MVLSVMSAFIFGVPMPVASSYPGVTGNRPLFVVVCPFPVMSWKYTLGAALNSRYSTGLMLPLRWPEKLSRSAMIADQNGDARLVPPMPNQPGGFCLLLKVPQSLNGVLALPGQ